MAGNTVSLDNVTQGGGLTFSHTVGTGAHRYIIVQVNLGPNTVSVQSITYAGVGLTRLARDNSVHTVEFWGLAEPASGTNNVVITLTGAAGSAQAAMSFQATGTIGVVGTGSANGNSTTAALTMTTGQQNDLLVGGVVNGFDATVTSGETVLWNDEAGDAAAFIYGGSSAKTITWTFQSAGAWGVAAAALRMTGVPGGSSSTWPAMKTAFLAQLQARPNLSGVQVTYGWPSGGADGIPSKELIALGGVRMQQAPKSLGNLRRDDRYTLSVIIDVVQMGKNQSACSTRAAALQAEVENQLRTDPLVNNCGILWAEFMGAEATDLYDGVSRECRIVCSVQCVARI